jgi:hypothetical protein
MIYYTLQENRLSGNHNDYYARVNIIHNVDADEFADFICARGSSFTKTDVVGLLQMMGETIESLVSQSYSVSLPFATFYSAIKGKFDGVTDGFDSSRHTVRPRVRPGAKLRAFFNNGISVEKETIDESRPIVKKYEDKESGSFNITLTPGGIGRLYGKSMAVDEADAAQGIFLIDSSNRRIKVEKIAETRPSFHAFIVPDSLTPGEYHISVINRHGAELREGILNKVLVVG